MLSIFFIGKQKVVLFLKYRENGWKSAASALKEYATKPFIYLKKKTYIFFLLKLSIYNNNNKKKNYLNALLNINNIRNIKMGFL